MENLRSSQKLQFSKEKSLYFFPFLLSKPCFLQPLIPFPSKLPTLETQALKHNSYLFVWEVFTFFCRARQIVTLNPAMSRTVPCHRNPEWIQPMFLLHVMWVNLHQNGWQSLSNYWKIPFTEMLLEAERDEVQSGSARQTKMHYSWSHICISCQTMHCIIQSPLMWLTAWKVVMTAGFLPLSGNHFIF